jgi:hypothetical protein
MTFVAILVGLAGAAASALLWLHRISPDSTFLESVTSHLTANATLSDRLEIVALAAGVLAIAMALLSVIGGKKGGTGVVIAVVLGIGALSYPVLVSLNIIGTNIKGPLK